MGWGGSQRGAGERKMEEERGLQRDKGQKGVRRMEEGRKRDKRVKRRGEKEKKEDVGQGRQY